MQKLYFLILLLVTTLFASCATVEKAEIKTIKESSKISNTNQQYNKKGLKRKVAIARFTNETKYGQSIFLNETNDKIGKQALDILSNKLLETDKFILLERADLDKITSELAIGNYSPLKNMADYLIVGSVTEFGRKNQGEVGIFSRTKKQIAFAKVHLRLIDVRTGKILYSEEGQGEAYSESGSVFGVGERAGYDSSLNDKALDSAITDLASNIIENLLDRPWVSYILGYENEKIIIAGGKSQNIETGNIFDVMKKGKTINNPQTNMPIILPGEKIASIQVETSIGDTPESEVSLCKIIQGDLSSYINSKNFTQLYIQEQ